jgi:membrane protein
MKKIDEATQGANRVIEKIFGFIKSILLAFKEGFYLIPIQASSLAYSTLLAVVPLLAVLVGIAKGFGFRDVLSRELPLFFPGHESEIDRALGYVDNYLAQAQGGVIIGIGLVLLFSTAVFLMRNIESTFNAIWHVPGRHFMEQLRNYLAFILILPVLLIISGGFSILQSTMQDTVMMMPVVGHVLRNVPFIIACLVFSLIYKFLPHTKVYWRYALVPGCIAGCAYQSFQMLYISGQIWVSQYNAVYGSFAAIPLLLLWLHLSWFIGLSGAELSYALQNKREYDKEDAVRKISLRCKNFLTLWMASCIAKRQEDEGNFPFTREELAEKCCLHYRIARDILTGLVYLNVVNETKNHKFIAVNDLCHKNIGWLLNQIEEVPALGFDPKDPEGIAWKKASEKAMKCGEETNRSKSKIAKYLQKIKDFIKPPKNQENIGIIHTFIISFFDSIDIFKSNTDKFMEGVQVWGNGKETAELEKAFQRYKDKVDRDQLLTNIGE